MHTPLRQKAFVTRIDAPATDVRIVHVRTNEKPAFTAGQYAFLSMPGLEPKPFSIASTPLQEDLEFHIRNTGEGPGARALEDLKPGDTLMVETPFGNGHWRDTGTRPLLAIAGGMGIAPLKAIAEEQLAKEMSVPVHIYWGARSPAQLYLHDFFEAMAARESLFSYTPVISEGLPDARYRHGFLTDALAADFPDLKGFAVYAAGPPAMMASLVPFLLEKGAEKDFIFGDGIL